MAAAAAQLINDLLRRTRGTQGVSTTRAQVLDFLDRCQVIVVRHTGTLIGSRSFTTANQQHIYPIDAAQTLRIVDIYDVDDNRLSQSSWTALVQQGGAAWWRETVASGAPSVWAHVGTNYFAIHPVALVGTHTLTLVEQTRPTRLDAETIELDLPEEHHPMLLNLVEALILFRNRDAALAPALQLLEATHGQG